MDHRRLILFLFNTYTHIPLFFLSFFSRRVRVHRLSYILYRDFLRQTCNKPRFFNTNRLFETICICVFVSMALKNEKKIELYVFNRREKNSLSIQIKTSSFVQNEVDDNGQKRFITNMKVFMRERNRRLFFHC